MPRKAKTKTTKKASMKSMKSMNNKKMMGSKTR
jgi:hypothetical protein